MSVESMWQLISSSYAMWIISDKSAISTNTLYMYLLEYRIENYPQNNKIDETFKEVKDYLKMIKKSYKL